MEKIEHYVKTMLENDLFAVIYPKDRSEESAEKLVDIIDSAVGVAKFKDEDGNSTWGVLIDKVKEAKRRMELDSSGEE